MCSLSRLLEIAGINNAQGAHLLGARVALLRREGRGEEEVHRHLEGVADRQVRLSLLLVVAFSLLVPAIPPPGAARAPPPFGAAAFSPQLGDYARHRLVKDVQHPPLDLAGEVLEIAVRRRRGVSRFVTSGCGALGGIGSTRRGLRTLFAVCGQLDRLRRYQ